MARYFFHLYECGTLVADEEGRECPDLNAARSQALTEAREIMSAEVKGGRLCVGCRVDVVDESGMLLLSLPFKEALGITGL